VNHRPFLALTTWSSAITIPFIVSLYSATIYRCPLLSLLALGTFLFNFFFTRSNGRYFGFSASYFLEPSCSSIVVIVLYDQQLQQSSLTSPLLEIFCSSIVLVIHDVTPVRRALSRHRLVTKNIVPET
jgi:hypothetical protein